MAWEAIEAIPAIEGAREVTAAWPAGPVDGVAATEPTAAAEPLVARDARAEALQIARHATVFIPSPLFQRPPARRR